MFEALKEMRNDMEKGEWIDWLSKQMGFPTVEAMLVDYMKLRALHNGNEGYCAHCATPMVRLKIDGGLYCPSCHRMVKVA